MAATTLAHHYFCIQTIPYFEYYERELHILFDTPYTLLADFNLATLHWLKQQLKPSFAEILTTEYIKQYEGAAYDLRNMKPAQNKNKNNFPSYYQLFSERNEFLPNLSILDLLFSEGPYAMNWINGHKVEILQFNNEINFKKYKTRVQSTLHAIPILRDILLHRYFAHISLTVSFRFNEI